MAAQNGNQAAPPASTDDENSTLAPSWDTMVVQSTAAPAWDTMAAQNDNQAAPPTSTYSENSAAAPSWNTMAAQNNNQAAPENNQAVPETVADFETAFLAVEPPSNEDPSEEFKRMRINPVHQTAPELIATIALNGKFYGEPIQPTLEGNNPAVAPVSHISAFCREGAQRTKIKLTWVANRAMDPQNTTPAEKVNPLGNSFYHINAFINGADVRDFKSVSAEEYGTMALQQIFSCSSFNFEGLGVTTWRSRRPTWTSLEVPKLHTPGLDRMMKSLADGVCKTKMSGDIFEFIVLHTWTINNQAMLREMQAGAINGEATPRKMTVLARIAEEI
jgi:hypothetical protein